MGRAKRAGLAALLKCPSWSCRRGEEKEERRRSFSLFLFPPRHHQREQVRLEKSGAQPSISDEYKKSCFLRPHVILICVDAIRIFHQFHLKTLFPHLRKYQRKQNSLKNELLLVPSCRRRIIVHSNGGDGLSSRSTFAPFSSTKNRISIAIIIAALVVCCP